MIDNLEFGASEILMFQSSIEASSVCYSGQAVLVTNSVNRRLDSSSKSSITNYDTASCYHYSRDGSCYMQWCCLAGYKDKSSSDYFVLSYVLLAGTCLAAVPCYIALYQSYKLLGYIDAGSVFSDLSVKALKFIRALPSQSLLSVHLAAYLSSM